MNKIITKLINIPKYIAIVILKIYKIFISPMFGNRCRFYPTCSDYTKQAIDKYGIIRGSLKGVLRILRCNPFFKGGIDNLK